jgi:hypothetical protein
MKTHFTLAALALGTALFATSAMADNMSSNTMAPSATGNTMAPAGTGNTMAPASGGMMAVHHKPKPKKHTTNTMAPANTMAPSNTMGGSH